eukprot:CFRG5777T1
MHSTEFAKDFDKWALVPSFGLITLSAYLCGTFGLGFASCLLLTWMSIHIAGRRLERYIRALDLGSSQRVRLVQQMNQEDGRESAKWLNQVVDGAWDCHRLVWSEQLRSKLDILLAMNKPKYLEDIFVDQLSLGEKGPSIHNVSSYRVKRVAQSFEIVIDAMFSYEAPTAAIVFGVKLRTIGVSASLSLSNVMLNGEMRIILLMHPGSASLAGMELTLRSYPSLDYEMRPLNTFDATEIPLLSSWLADTFRTLISGSVVNPNKIFIDLGSQTDTTCFDMDQYGDVVGQVMVACPLFDSNVCPEILKTNGLKYEMDVTFQATSRVAGVNVADLSKSGVASVVVRARHEAMTLTIYSLGKKSGETAKVRREVVGRFSVAVAHLMSSTNITDCDMTLLGTSTTIPVRYIYQPRHKMEALTLSNLVSSDYGTAVAKLDLHNAFVDWKGSVGSPILRISLNDKCVFTSKTYKRSAMPIIKQTLWLAVENVYMAALKFEILVSTEKKMLKNGNEVFASTVCPLSRMIEQGQAKNGNGSISNNWIYLEEKLSAVNRVHRIRVTCKVFSLYEGDVTFGVPAKMNSTNKQCSRCISSMSTIDCGCIDRGRDFLIPMARAVCSKSTSKGRVKSVSREMGGAIGSGAHKVKKTMGRLGSPSLGRVSSPSISSHRKSASVSMGHSTSTDLPSIEYDTGETGLDTQKQRSHRKRSNSLSNSGKHTLGWSSIKELQRGLKVYMDIIRIDDFWSPDRTEPDTCVIVKVNGNNVYRTKTILNTSCPTFSESTSFSVAPKDCITLRIKDKSTAYAPEGNIELPIEHMAVDEWERKTIPIRTHPGACICLLLLKTDKHMKEMNIMTNLFSGISDEPISTTHRFPDKPRRGMPTEDHSMVFSGISDDSIISRSASQLSVSTSSLSTRSIVFSMTNSDISVTTNDSDRGKLSSSQLHTSIHTAIRVNANLCTRTTSPTNSQIRTGAPTTAFVHTPQSSVSSEQIENDANFIDKALLETICGSVDTGMDKIIDTSSNTVKDTITSFHYTDTSSNIVKDKVMSTKSTKKACTVNNGSSSNRSGTQKTRLGKTTSLLGTMTKNSRLSHKFRPKSPSSARSVDSASASAFGEM